MSDLLSDLPAALQKHFGFSGFRPGQEAVVRSVLEGRNTVAVMPTGAGKSLCYQLPALLLPGTALVISPLVALMKDQVDALIGRGVSATFINSSLSDAEKQSRMDAMRRGAYKLVYVAPERFRSGAFLQALQSIQLSLFAVDEAHCISQWGHDFRPDYTRLGQARWALRPPRTMALTATATPEVRNDIVRVLRLKEPRVSVAGFDRPNLFLEVAKVGGDRDKLDRIAAACRAGGGIVYCATRKDVEKVADQLHGYGVPALAYHAGMRDSERERVQETFMTRTDAVVCATNAFGMGVDKPELRFVAHFAIPKTVEAYYQEIGRAGRDGKPARALLLFNHADVFVQERLMESNYPSPDLIRRLWVSLCAEDTGQEFHVDEARLGKRLGASGMEVGAALRYLERADHLVRVQGGVLVREPQLDPDSLRVDFQTISVRKTQEQNMLKRMTSYAYHQACRRSYLIAYFGDAPVTCSGCDVCNGPWDEAPGAPGPVQAVKPVKRRAKPSLPASRKGPPARTSRADDDDDFDFDEAVFEELRQMRSTLAKAEEVPPYVVFHDRTLKAIARDLPESRQELLDVSGVGPAKWERYGPHVLDVVARALSRARSSGGGTR